MEPGEYKADNITDKPMESGAYVSNKPAEKDMLLPRDLQKLKDIMGDRLIVANMSHRQNSPMNK